MKRAFVRSQLFNFSYFGITAFFSILYLPALLLPREMFIALVRFWLLCVTFFEYTILNLKYEIRGGEHIPKEGSYIIAAKHQSAYETLKIRLLFNDPAIVLKKELLQIPLWGWSLAKSGVIAIDRGTPERALRSLQNGALRMKEAGRPIVIFPQGTRVSIHDTSQEKPYKPGIARVQEITQLPIIPLALNSGVFWPKNTWLKSSGTVIFEFMEPIPPGKDKQVLMRELEDKIETRSNMLTADARRRLLQPERKHLRGIFFTFFLVLALCAAYICWWGVAARHLKEEYLKLSNLRGSISVEMAPLVITGFPAMNIHRNQENFQTSDGTLDVHNIDVHGWPLPFIPVTIHTGEVSIRSYKWMTPVTLDNFEASVRYWPEVLTILDSTLNKDVFKAKVAGTIDLAKEPYPEADLGVSFKNHHVFLNYLAEKNIVDERTAVFMAAGFNALADKDGVVNIPVTQRGRKLFAGPFMIAELPEGKPAIVTPSTGEMEALPAPSP